MPKFLHVAQIFNFCTFFQTFISDFKHIVLSCLEELPVLPYVVGNYEMSSFQTTLNRRQIPLVTPDMS